MYGDTIKNNYTITFEARHASHLTNKIPIGKVCSNLRSKELLNRNTVALIFIKTCDA